MSEYIQKAVSDNSPENNLVKVNRFSPKAIWKIRSSYRRYCKQPKIIFYIFGVSSDYTK